LRLCRRRPIGEFPGEFVTDEQFEKGTTVSLASSSADSARGRPAPFEPTGRIAGQVLRGERSQKENNHVSQTQDDTRRRNGLVSEGDGGDALIW
jgi:hypothetical protein